MKNCIDFMVRLGRDEEGTALLEYTMLLGLIAVAVITAAIAVGAWVGGRWGDLCASLNTASGVIGGGAAINCTAGTGA
jgi:pilus assembly protein Flp/PilA